MKDVILFKVITDVYLYNLFVQSVGLAECLTPIQRPMYKKAIEFWKAHNRCPTEAEAKTLFGKDVSVEGISREFTFDVVLNEIRIEKLKYWILNVAEDIEQNKVDYGKVYNQLALLKDKLEVHMPKGVAVDSLKDTAVELESAKARVDVLKTGINSLDYALRGGLHKGELMFLIAPPGRGKSTFLVNLFYSFLLSRKSTLFLSNELRVDTILSRLYRRIMKMGRKEFIPENKKEIEKGLNQFFKYTKGKGLVHYVPVDTWGVNDIKSWVTAWEKQIQVPVDAVIIDYVDRLQKPKEFEYRLRLKALVDQLRDYAVDKELHIASATQTNRSGLSAPLVMEEHVAEAFSKIESSDVILSLSQSQTEREAQKARIAVLKNREYGGVGSVIDVQAIWDQLTLADFEYNQ